MKTTPPVVRKPYVAPTIVEQGQVASVTHQVTPTFSVTPTPGGSEFEEFDEF